jgi:cobalt-zinc-cadmium efflux system outer membrane protein
VAAQADVDAATAEARLARGERIPDITATGGYKRQSDDLHGGYLGLSISLPIFDRNSGAVRAADARVEAAQQRLALTRRQLENDLRGAADAYRSLHERAASVFAGSRGDRADLLEVARLAYDAGEMDLVGLLDAAEALLEARTAEARLRAELWIAYYDLERALGGWPTTGSTDIPEPAR